MAGCDRRGLSRLRAGGYRGLAAVVAFSALCTAFPAAAPASPRFTVCPHIGKSTGCAALIAVQPQGRYLIGGKTFDVDNRAALLADPSQAPFDTSYKDPDDRESDRSTGKATLVGVHNGTNRYLRTIVINGPRRSRLFNLDGYGLCDLRHNCTFDEYETGYEGPNVMLVPFDTNAANVRGGTVTFTLTDPSTRTPGLPPGGSAYFALSDLLPKLASRGTMVTAQTFDPLGAGPTVHSSAARLTFRDDAYLASEERARRCTLQVYATTLEVAADLAFRGAATRVRIGAAVAIATYDIVKLLSTEVTGPDGRAALLSPGIGLVADLTQEQRIKLVNRVFQAHDVLSACRHA